MLILLRLLSGFFVLAGVLHFIAPEAYLAIVPPWLPGPLPLVYVSGAAEIAGGLGVLFPMTRRLAGAGLIALLIAVFPANVYAAMLGMMVGGHAVAPWLLWMRLPLQALLIWWVHAAAWKRQAPPRG
ncbi:MAG: hypothetical protein ABI946_05060 [Chthoniobacterales bacterium]